MEILVILLLIGINGFLALAEMAIASARKARLKRLVEEGVSGADTALELAGHPTRYFSTIQVGITLIGILSGAFGGATLAETIGAWFEQFPPLAMYGEGIGLGIVVLGITYLTLVLGELVPKRLAQNNAEQIAVRVAEPLHLLSRLTSPAVTVLTRSTEFVLRVFGAVGPRSPSITEEEVKIMLREGTEIGVFNVTETEMIKHVLWLADRKISTMMTHRTEVEWLDLGDPPGEIEKKIASAQHSRLPVSQGLLDGVVGILVIREYLSQAGRADNTVILNLLREPLFVPEAMTALELLDQFKKTRKHLAVVVDEFGGVVGIITPSDVLVSIVGDLPDIDESEEPKAIQREDGSWLLDGTISSEEIKDFLSLLALPGEKFGNYETLGGMIMDQLGRIPVSGDHFEWNGLRFEVVDMDGRRVDKVLVSAANGK